MSEIAVHITTTNSGGQPKSRFSIWKTTGQWSESRWWATIRSKAWALLFQHASRSMNSCPGRSIGYWRQNPFGGNPNPSKV